MYQLPVKQVKTKIMLLHNKVDVAMIDLYNKMFVKPTISILSIS